MVRLMISAIFILLSIILILSIRIDVFLKSVDDTIKLYLKVGMLSVVIPHQRLIFDLIEKEKQKPSKKRIEDINNVLKSKGLILNIFSHSSLDRLYVRKISTTSVYNTPIINAILVISISRIRAFAHNSFKAVDNDFLVFNYDNDYENVDYYIQAHTDVISIVYACISTYIFKR